MNKKLIIPAVLSILVLAGCNSNANTQMKKGSLSGSKIDNYLSVTPVDYEVVEGVEFTLSYEVTVPTAAAVNQVTDTAGLFSLHPEFAKCGEGTNFYEVVINDATKDFGVIFRTNINTHTLRFDFYGE